MDSTDLEESLEKKCKNHVWLMRLLFFTSTPIIFNAAHLASYEFLGGDPSFSCNIPELVEANWTTEQIRYISSPRLEKQSCFRYAWNYSLLKDLGYEEALSYYNKAEKPDLIKCNSYIYDEETSHQTIVSEWDLVCDEMPFRSAARSSVAIGKLLGASVLGLLSDKFGRKKTFIFSALLIMLAGPSTALVHSPEMFTALRILIGFATAGLFETTFTILTEMTVKNYRQFSANIFSIAYSLGIVYLPVAAYLTKNWRQLQLAISVPMFALVIHFWFMPESHRWLMTKGKLKNKSNNIGSEVLLRQNELHLSHTSIVTKRSYCKSVVLFFKDYLKLFSTKELAKRTLICYYLSFKEYFCFYIIALNGSNLGVDPYLYMALNGLIDVPAWFLPIILLTFFGRKSSGIVLLIIFGIAMMLLPVLPQGWPIFVATIVGRLVGTATGGITTLLTVELFPTENRNTAVGSCVTVSQLGPLLAPYVAEIGRQKLWWIPSVLSGFIAFLGAFFMMFLEETRDKPMLDTIREMKNQGRGDVQEGHDGASR